ncbi:unnamed protein product [Caenorhabditis angaria]|uniref:Uncharacterized protein n=1 Tax=Caenorhabditis angaria TaxID=860376 RepID=A0A9P1ND13_9PELO|nr:unnamed protein product [Caenorhabditis angaria]
MLNLNAKTKKVSLHNSHLPVLLNIPKIEIFNTSYVKRTNHFDVDESHIFSANLALAMKRAKQSADA